MKPENEAAPAMKLMKLRIATGLGFLLFMAAMIDGCPAKQITLADLAGNFAGRASGFQTVCFNAGSTAPADCASAPNPVPFDLTQVSSITRDAAGNSCALTTGTSARVSGTKLPTTATTRTVVGKNTSFDPTTGTGTASLEVYDGGGCSGADFIPLGAPIPNPNPQTTVLATPNTPSATQTATATTTFVASNFGNRIETIVTSFDAVTSARASSVAGSVKGVVFSQTAIRR